MSIFAVSYFVKEWVAEFKTGEAIDKVMSLIALLIMVAIDYVAVTGI